MEISSDFDKICDERIHILEYRRNRNFKNEKLVETSTLLGNRWVLDVMQNLNRLFPDIYSS